MRSCRIDLLPIDVRRQHRGVVNLERVDLEYVSIEHDEVAALSRLQTSDRVVPVAQASALDRALSRCRSGPRNLMLPGTEHGFDINWGGFGTQIARAKIEGFLQQH